MLTVDEARDAIFEAVPDFGIESTSSASAAGRVLRQRVVAERDQPPFDRVMMDGVAIAFEAFAAGKRRFDIQSTQAAGDPQQVLQPDQCIEIMTGAALPAGADCIIPVERIAVHDSTATLEEDYEPEARQFIHPRGSDHAAGAALLEPGKRLSAMDIAVVHSCGLTDIEVSRRPAIRIVSTGNELVPAGAPIEPHQVRLSNGPALMAMLQQHGYADCVHDHLADEPKLLEDRIGEHLENADILILSGGVSMGKADYVPQVLKQLGVDVVFHKISQRPGKPMWFGIGPRQQAVFALPGNPVSTLVCCRQYVIPALSRASGSASRPPEFAALAQDISFKPELTCFLPVRLVASTNGQVLAVPVPTNTSGDFAALSNTDGLIELPREQTHFAAGTALPLHRWLALG